MITRNAIINCKIELKLKYIRHCVFSANSNDNPKDKRNNIIFTIKDTILYVLVVTLSAEDNKKLSKLLSKEYKRSVYWNEYKAKRYYLPKSITKNYNFIINGKNVYGQPTDSDIKQYKEIKKLTTGEGEDYITRCLLDNDYIKNHYRLIEVV